MSDSVYITTPLYYVNAEPHLGSTYTNVVTDAWARFHRQRGRKTFFQTGTDEHGEKIAEAAAAAESTPREFVDQVSAKFRSVWDSCGIEYDYFIRTSDEHHIRFVQDMLSRIHEQDDIYFGEYTGLYCVGCERLYTEKELEGGLCPQHKTEPIEMSEPNYFFRMSKYQDQVREYIEANPDFIRPEGYRKEALAMLREPLGDLCISRPKERLSWGIELPFDDNYVCYVWFDALLNYISGLDDVGKQDEFWPGAEHFIGKDILKPHAVFWPCMLLAAGLPLYRHLNVHGFWSSGGQKMSKSLGNVVAPLTMRDRYTMDGLRYFLLRDMAFGQDADFTEENLVTRLNADLANGLGNLASRTLAMTTKYFDSQVQAIDPREEIDNGLAEAFAQARLELDKHIGNLAFHRGLEALWRGIDAANKYVVETAPFKLIKDESQAARVGAILHNCLESIRVAGQLIAPFMPDASENLRVALGLSEAAWDDIDLPWGEAFKSGDKLAAKLALFPRIES
ncbi:MAG: methionine--tRNA ligase [Deltaproteobacteria bacterium]